MTKLSQIEDYLALSLELRKTLKKLVKDANHLSSISPLINYHTKVSAIKKSELAEQYLPDVLAIDRCIGARLSASYFGGDLVQSGAVSHQELTLYVALRAIEALNEHENYWVSFSGTPEKLVPDNRRKLLTFTNKDLADEKEVWRIEWLRTLFRCVLCLPVGFMISHSVMRFGSDAKVPSWSPTFENMGKYEERYGKIEVRPSKFEFGARAIALSTYMRVYGHNTKNIPNLSLAEADFFSDFPNRQNPLYRAFHVAMKHVFYDRLYLKIPYWWALTLNGHFCRTADYTPVECVVDAGVGLKWSTRQLEVKQQAEEGESADEGTDVNDTLIETSEVDETQVRKQTVDLSDDPVNSTTLNPRVRGCVLKARELLNEGAMTANRGGAALQRISGVLHLVVPMFWQGMVAHAEGAEVSEDEIFKAFFDSGLLAIDEMEDAESTFEIRPVGSPRRRGKMRTIPLTELGQKMFYPLGCELDDNPDLFPLKPKAVAAA